MKAKEIHDLLLSLFLRGLGIWILYGVVENVNSLIDLIWNEVFRPTNDFGPSLLSDLLFLAGRIALAGYFILGAPPFLKWATRPRG